MQIAIEFFQMLGLFARTKMTNVYVYNEFSIVYYVYVKCFQLICFW